MSDKVYTSNFTGSQIDEAVGKVINGDIEGSNIKEGSIPLSALADDVKDKLNNIFIAPEDFIEEQYDEPDEAGFVGKVKQVYVTDILENRYNKINMPNILDGITGDIKITDGLINFTYKYEIFQSGLKQEYYGEMFIRVQDCKFKQVVYLNTSPFGKDAYYDYPSNVSDIRYNFVTSVTDEQITIPEENKQLFKKNMGSFADWNAEKGEAGHIENKPFSIDYITISDNPVISNMSVSGFENSETYEVSRQYESYMNIIGLCYEHSGYNGMVYVPIKYGEITTFYQTLYYKGYSDRIIIKIDAAYGPVGSRQIKVKSGSKITKIIGVAGFNKIDENFIPKTVLKTTPQTLSDADKNQVKENLGISTPATPDWNAQKGEAGYIENKPFGGTRILGEIIIDSREPLIRSVNYTIPINEFDTIKMYYNSGYVDWINLQIDMQNKPADGVAIDGVSESPIGDFEIRYYEESDYIQLAVLSTSIPGDEDTFSTMGADYILNDCIVEGIKKLPTQYLPIDPVVWKYMCEPYVINPDDSEGTIPQELVSIIFNDNGHLRPIVQKLIVFPNDFINNWYQNELYSSDGACSIAIDTDGTWRNI